MRVVIGEEDEFPADDCKDMAADRAPPRPAQKEMKIGFAEGGQFAGHQAAGSMRPRRRNVISMSYPSSRRSFSHLAGEILQRLLTLLTQRANVSF